MSGESAGDGAADHGELTARAARGTPWIAAASWLNRIFVLVVVLTLAKRLQAEQLGVLGVATLASNVAMQFNDAGFGDALVWWRGRFSAAAQTTLAGCLAVGAVAGALLAILAPFIAAAFSAPDATPLLRVYGVAVFFDATAGAYLAILIRELAFRRRFVPDVVPAIIGSGLTIALAIVGVGIWSLVIGDVVRSALQLGLGFAVAGRHVVPHWHRQVAATMWRYGRAALSGSFLEFALQNVDYALVGLLLGPVALGFYTIAFRVAILPFLVVTYVIAGVAFPLYARIHADRVTVNRVMQSTMRACCALVFPMGVGLAVLAPYIELLGERWEPAVAVARLLGVYVCLRSSAFMVSMLLRAVAPVANAVLRGAWVVLLVVAIATVGRASIVGVAVVQVVVALALLCAYLLVARRLVALALRPLVTDILTLGVAAAAAAGGTLLLQRWTGAAGDPTSVLGFVLFGAVFVVLDAAAVAVLMPHLRRDVRGLFALARRTPAAVAPAGVSSPVST